MIGIDTNILARHLTQDDPVQAKIVEEFFDKHALLPNSIFINNIVMCELVWVLERGYKYSKENIASAVKQILYTEEFVFEDQKLLWLALNEYSMRDLDFADALIGELNKENDCIETVTFDQNAAKANNFKLINDVLDSL
ncbi:MAG: type II toxin-antitoxin system VapC family toxin [Rickettsiaceae bacterium]|nr:type II toxin-antitoxin system VapC family toxin [Rickettsiaceae bacterium]